MGKSRLVAAVAPDHRGVARVPAPPAGQEPVWATWAADLQRLGGAASSASIASAEERADALAAQWETIPVPRRPALVVEDAHWTDEETLRLLERLAGTGVPHGLRLLITLRPGGGPAARVVAFARALDGLVLELSPWQKEESIQHACDLLGVSESALDPSLVERIHDAEGWPLLVDELVTAWRRGLAPPAWGATRLEALVAERLASLPSTAREVVARAALLGAEPDTDVVARSFPEPNRVATALRAAVRSGLLVTHAIDGRLVFRHELVRDAVVAELVDLEQRVHAAALLRVLEDPAEWPWRWQQVADLAALVGRADLAVEAGLSGADAALAAGSPLVAAGLAEGVAAVAHGAAKVRALGLAVRALALAGDVTAAFEADARFDAAESVDPAPEVRSSVHEAKARALGVKGRWSEALELLPAGTASSIRALALLETGDHHAAAAVAGQVLATVSDPAGRCEAMEVAGRVARRTDLAAAEGWFSRAAAQAESAQLPLWRARALHELATVTQMRSLDVAPLERAREAAVAAGAMGLVTSVDFHIAAVHGVRFEPEPALLAGRRLLAAARRLGLTSQEAWAWILIGQAHAVAGERLRAEQAVQDAAALAGSDPELQAMSVGVGAVAALVDDDDDVALSRWQQAVRTLRRSQLGSPLPPWYLWPVLATVHDLDGDGGARAREEVRTSDVTTFVGVAGLCRVADAVALGRGGDAPGAARAWEEGAGLIGGVPSFVGWLHLAHCRVAGCARDDGWGDPDTWLAEAERWFADRGLARLVARCRATSRALGLPRRRRGRGLAEVPPHLHDLGVTSREMDVLLLVADGLTNAQVAERLVLSPGTVKGYVERLLAKTGATNRTELSALLARR